MHNNASQTPAPSPQRQREVATATLARPARKGRRAPGRARHGGGLACGRHPARGRAARAVTAAPALAEQRGRPAAGRASSTTGARAMHADVIVVGAGLTGLVATAELTAAGRRVLLIEQEPEASLGGQAFWSFGGLFLVDSPEQRRLRIRDSHALAWQDWLGSAGFDRPEDHWPRRWAEAYVGFAAAEKRAWLKALGMRWFPVVGWAERGGYTATQHGNSVPRFHVTWGTGPGVL